jgi:hypothetical protein
MLWKMQPIPLQQTELEPHLWQKLAARKGDLVLPPLATKDQNLKLLLPLKVIHPKA